MNNNMEELSYLHDAMAAINIARHYVALAKRRLGRNRVLILMAKEELTAAVQNLEFIK